MLEKNSETHVTWIMILLKMLRIRCIGMVYSVSMVRFIIK